MKYFEVTRFDGKKPYVLDYITGAVMAFYFSLMIIPILAVAYPVMWLVSKATERKPRKNV